jgi:putative methionine-R-sulfoxide reductase with GAF domain
MTNVENYENYGINTESTKSEIDIPCVGKGNKLQAVLNIKSRQTDMYDHIDKQWLSAIVKLVYDGDNSLVENQMADSTFFDPSAKLSTT